MEALTIKRKVTNDGIKELVHVRFTLAHLNIVYVVRTVTKDKIMEYVFTSKDAANMYFDLIR